jgi:hypothetical protein
MVFLVFSSPAAAAPAVELQDGSISRKVLAEAIKKHDADFIAKDKLLAKPLDPNMVVILPKLKVDYSGFLTLTGNQDGWGGCIGRSMVHVMDMLNEMEHPYTPDLSFWYLHVRQDQLANGGPVNTKYLLENYGLAPEAMFPSDYDKAKLVNGQWDYSGMPQPTAAIDQAASLYKVKLLSEPYTPTVKTIKNLLVHYGPILASGPMVKLLGPNPPEGHCVTIVGYDDTTSSFKCLNSWGDYWNGNGFFYLNYNEVAANLTAVRYIEDGPSDRTGTAQAFTARIWLEGQNVSRNKLTVKIGKDGKQPTVVWDTPNEINCIDNSRMLKIDVPMPNYPLSILPAKPWYVEITNSSSGTVVVKELTLARLLKENGVFTTKVTKYPQSGMIIPAKTTVKYYFPTQQLIIKADVNDFPVVLKKNPE